MNLNSVPGYRRTG